LEAWLSSPFAADGRCHLVFVGGHQMAGVYQRELVARLEGAQASSAIQITGYVAPDTYRDWLAAADLGVRLPAHSRGETSRAVLDAMAHGVPVIVNAHGSAGELPAAAVERLAGECSIADIADALARCRAPGRRAALAAEGARYVRAVHDPGVVA